MYNFQLFSLVAQNSYGQAVPIAFLITSDGRMDTLKIFLNEFKKIYPWVGTFMTDNDDAEIGAIEAVYPESNHLLCWWHILRNWRIRLLQPQNISNDPNFKTKLFDLLMNSNDFEADFEQLLSIASPEFSKYLQTFLYPKREKWAHQFRKYIKMYKSTNSNMLIESFHNILKTKFFNKKFNRRIDRLIYILMGPIQAHYSRKERANKFGMNGPTAIQLAVERESILARSISDHAIVFQSAGIYHVESKSLPGSFYEVDTDVKSCTCDTFKINNFCRHLFKCEENLDNDFEIDCLSNDIEVNLSFENSSHSSEKDGESSFDPNIWENITKYVTLNPISSTFYAKVVNLFSLEVSSFPNPEKIAPNQNNTGLSCLKFKKKKGFGRPKQIL